MNAQWRDKPRIPILIAAMQYACIAAMALIVLAGIVGDVLGSGQRSWDRFNLAFVFGIFVLLALGRVLGHRAWQRIIASDFNVCPCCEYSLRGLPAAARCPECGEPYESEKVQAHWKERLQTAAKAETCLRLSPSGMQRYTRYSIWMLASAGVFVGLGVAHTLGYSFIFSGMAGRLLVLVGFGLMIAQPFLLPRWLLRTEKKRRPGAMV